MVHLAFGRPQTTFAAPISPKSSSPGEIGFWLPWAQANTKTPPAARRVASHAATSGDRALQQLIDFACTTW